MVRSFFVCIKFIRDESIDFNVRMTILAVYTACYLQFSVEPVVQGMPWLFMLFCVVHGMVERLYCYAKEKRY